MQIKTECKDRVTGSSDVAGIFHNILINEEEVDRSKEHFWVIGLRTNNMIDYIELVSLGTLDRTLVHPREVFRLAIMKAVKSIMLVHNHPSGEVTSSHEDREITAEFKRCGEILHVKVLDHIIIGGNSTHYSFADDGRI